jgi:hypothetical protein
MALAIASPARTWTRKATQTGGSTSQPSPKGWSSSSQSPARPPQCLPTCVDILTQAPAHQTLSQILCRSSEMVQPCSQVQAPPSTQRTHQVVTLSILRSPRPSTQYSPLNTQLPTSGHGSPASLLLGPGTWGGGLSDPHRNGLPGLSLTRAPGRRRNYRIASRDAQYGG